MNAGIFTAGGALTDEEAAVYIERPTDQETAVYLQAMKYLQIIEPRQQGKTSFVNRLIYRAVLNDMIIAYVDASTIDHSTEARCYHSLCQRILDQWQEFVPPDQRPTMPANSLEWRGFLHAIAVHAGAAKRRILIVLDEIGAADLPNATGFFSVLRDVYNSRQAQAAFRNLTFLLVGAFRPRDLIDDDSISPFNIAQRLRLPDFTFGQVQELVVKGGWPEEQTRALSERIHYWTDGHPYLTQLLCSYLGPQATPADVDQGVERLRREDLNNLPPLLKALNKDAKLRAYLDGICAGKRIQFYPQAHQGQARLELLGVLKADSDGYCSVRNRIYEHALSAAGEEAARAVKKPTKAGQPDGARALPGVQDAFLYDIFISYSSKDFRWVRDRLLPLLMQADLRICIDYLSFDIGKSNIANIENAVRNSKRTLLVITRNWLKSEWTEFEDLLARMKDLTGRRQRVLPILVRRCKLPEHLDILTPLYLTRPTEFDQQMQRLINTIRSALPPFA